MTKLERRIVAAVVLIVIAGAVGGFVLKRSIDHIGDRADRALGKASQVSVRVDGLEDIRAQVDGVTATVSLLADKLQAGIALDLVGVRGALDSLAATLAAVPGQVDAASAAAAAQFAALLDAASGLVADIGRALDPVGALATQLGQPIQSQVDVDVHLVRTFVADLLGLLPQILAGLA